MKNLKELFPSLRKRWTTLGQRFFEKNSCETEFVALFRKNPPDKQLYAVFVVISCAPDKVHFNEILHSEEDIRNNNIEIDQHTPWKKGKNPMDAIKIAQKELDLAHEYFAKKPQDFSKLPHFSDVWGIVENKMEEYKTHSMLSKLCGTDVGEAGPEIVKVDNKGNFVPLRYTPIYRQGGNSAAAPVVPTGN